MSTYWWAGQWTHLRFILRELSSLSVAYFVVLTLVGLDALGRGPQPWAEFLNTMSSPALIVLNAVAFVFALLHALTWFNLAPRAIAVRVGRKRVPDFWIAASNYGAWVIASALVAWVLLR
jgi:fumarate reductase subunit C